MKRLRTRHGPNTNSSDDVEASRASEVSHPSFEIDMEVVSKASSLRQRKRKQNGGIASLSFSKFSSAEVSSKAEGGDSVQDDDDSELVTRSSGTSWTSWSRFSPNRSVVFSVLVGSIGLIASTLFLAFGVSASVNEQENLFRTRSYELSADFSKAWEDYQTAALWLHQACSFHPVSPNDFIHIYEYLNTTVTVQAAAWVPMLLDENRSTYEATSTEFYSTQLPDFDYNGIQGYEPDPGSPTGTLIQNRSQQDFYFPINLIEPLENNVWDIDFDLYSSESMRESIKLATEAYIPILSAAFNSTSQYEEDTRVAGLDDDGVSEEDVELPPLQAVRLFHPGIPISDQPLDQPPDSFASLTIDVDTVLQRATRYLVEDISVYIYDATDDLEDPKFLMAAELYVSGDVEEALAAAHAELAYLPAMSYPELVETTVVFIQTTDISIASRTWRLAVVALSDTFQPNILDIILTGKFILLACLCISLWIFTNLRRARVVAELKRERDADKAAMVVQSAREAAKAEQELNDYISHEIRNPVAAAMSACAFVQASVNEPNPMSTPASILAVREDVDIIDSSLSFANSLLRSMLDMHRAASKKILVEIIPVDIKQDILHPVCTMLYHRDSSIQVSVVCRDNLVVMSDRLRLTQIMLNLGRNALKFVRKGFVRLGAEIVGEDVSVFVEDSGFGIPMHKRAHLFAKFQESLDILEQGTGVGLCLCKHMAEPLHAEISLDEDYDSGVEGFPGARFVIDLKTSPLSEEQYSTYIFSSERAPRVPARQVVIEEETDDDVAKELQSRELKAGAVSSADTTSKPSGRRTLTKAASMEPGLREISELPPTIVVLFVDDDMVLRKLFTRSLKRVVPASWTIHEAANGETCLKMVESMNYDIIFMDQYMASVEKQLLGTETTRALRSKGVTSRICGLSANDMEEEFFRCGADFFLLKPFPCKPDILKAEVLNILNVRQKNQSERAGLMMSEKTPSDSTSLSTVSPDEVKPVGDAEAP